MFSSIGESACLAARSYLFDCTECRLETEGSDLHLDIYGGVIRGVNSCRSNRRLTVASGGAPFASLFLGSLLQYIPLSFQNLNYSIQHIFLQ